MDVQWPALVVGVLCIIGGLIAFRYRGGIAESTADGQEALFGARWGARFKRRANGRNAAIAPLGFVGIGLIAVLLAIF
jgi:hypothetical protein